MKKVLLTMSCVVMVATGFRAIRFVADGMLEQTQQEQQDAETLKAQAVAADPSL